jgi:hypothetical protein
VALSLLATITGVIDYPAPYDDRLAAEELGAE